MQCAATAGTLQVSMATLQAAHYRLRQRNSKELKACYNFLSDCSTQVFLFGEAGKVCSGRRVAMTNMLIQNPAAYLFEVSVQHSLHVVIIEGRETGLCDIDWNAIR